MKSAERKVLRNRRPHLRRPGSTSCLRWKTPDFGFTMCSASSSEELKPSESEVEEDEEDEDDGERGEIMHGVASDAQRPGFA